MNPEEKAKQLTDTWITATGATLPAELRVQLEGLICELIKAERQEFTDRLIFARDEFMEMYHGEAPIEH